MNTLHRAPSTERLAPPGAGLLEGALTLEEHRRLAWLRATYAAQGHLREDGFTDDLEAARHLAFGLWLRATGRLEGEFTLARDGGTWTRIYPRTKRPAANQQERR